MRREGTRRERRTVLVAVGGETQNALKVCEQHFDLLPFPPRDAIGSGLSNVARHVAGDLNTAFESLMQQRAWRACVATDGYLFSQRNQIVALASRHGIPGIYDRREYCTSGGLMSYGTHLREAFRQMGLYVARILKGEKTTDLPVVQPTKFELVINLKTAKTLGLSVPLTLQASAEEVIE